VLAADEIEAAFSDAADASDSILPVEPYAAVLAAADMEDREADATESAELYCEDAESRTF
jgi:hypothetical protein